MYTERVPYKKRAKDEKRLTVSIDEEFVEQDFKKNQNVATKSSKKLQSKSKLQASHQDSTYEELDLSKLNDNNDNHQSLNANEENTTYQELDVAQMNKEDDYQALNANEGDTIYQEVDTTLMKEEDNDYMSMTTK
ncbi:uncharacterized protein LOC124450462 [Xenia sp. Carnegie-2017]|uniref:uncharacterized protein LOC124450462 n=1 Tax=Xenia sp. Carnegie-2017 TaxID=2897299 RepID=UPI001F0396AB|nr:uncharacterized protein LOC124450462 [Xenia sp. Carnegie-2017]